MSYRKFFCGGLHLLSYDTVPVVSDQLAHTDDQQNGYEVAEIVEEAFLVD